MLIVDGHLDLAMNAIEWNRDLTRPIDELREREGGKTDKPDRGRGTVCFPEMRRGSVDWQLIIYGGAVHSFTNPDAGSDNAKGAAYNKLADHRSWAAMRQFFTELFGAETSK